MRVREDAVLAEFCHALAILDGQPARIVERPDRVQGSGCEAIIERVGQRWALEHTTFDTFPDQRLDDARLRNVLDPAMPTIAAAHPDWHITVSVPIGAVEAGRRWDHLQQGLAQAVIEALRAFGPDQRRARIEPPGLFEIFITRRSGSPGCFLWRHISDSEVAQRADTLGRALADKRAQLQPHAAAGTPTILLLDNDDLANTAPDAVAESFQKAAAGADLGVFTDIFFVDSTEQPPWFYPLKLSDRINPEPEHRRFFERQCRQTYGLT